MSFQISLTPRYLQITPSAHETVRNNDYMIFTYSQGEFKSFFYALLFVALNFDGKLMDGGREWHAQRLTLS